jgi:RNA polymerase sigma-70 factor (ECF subfamily)
MESPATRASLLLRLRDDSDAEAWQEFVRLYGPIVYRFARKRGLQDADAADLMQEVLRSVATAAGKLEYDPQRGSFRGWLYTITRNKIYTFLERRRHREQATGDSAMQQRLQAAPDRDSELEASWDQEYQQQLASRAMETIRAEFQPGTWQAFWLTAVEGIAAKDAAVQLNSTPGAVYVAKSRVLARLREEVQRLQEEE